MSNESAVPSQPPGNQEMEKQTGRPRNKPLTALTDKGRGRLEGLAAAFGSGLAAAAYTGSLRDTVTALAGGLGGTAVLAAVAYPEQLKVALKQAGEKVKDQVKRRVIRRG
jgi:hypothetical protein